MKIENMMNLKLDDDSNDLDLINKLKSLTLKNSPINNKTPEINDIPSYCQERGPVTSSAKVKKSCSPYPLNPSTKVLPQYLHASGGGIVCESLQFSTNPSPYSFSTSNNNLSSDESQYGSPSSSSSIGLGFSGSSLGSIIESQNNNLGTFDLCLSEVPVIKCTNFSKDESSPHNSSPYHQYDSSPISTGYLSDASDQFTKTILEERCNISNWISFIPDSLSDSDTVLKKNSSINYKDVDIIPESSFLNNFAPENISNNSNSLLENSDADKRNIEHIINILEGRTSNVSNNVEPIPLDELLNDVSDVVLKNLKTSETNKSNYQYPDVSNLMNNVPEKSNDWMILVCQTPPQVNYGKKFRHILPKPTEKPLSQTVPDKLSKTTKSVFSTTSSDSSFPSRDKLEKELDKEKCQKFQREILVKAREDCLIIRTQSEDGRTNLQRAICEGRIEEAYELSEWQINWVKTDMDAALKILNISDNSGKTALHYAAIHNQPLFVDYLLECGANSVCKDINGNTPLHYAVENGDSCLQLSKSLIQNYKEKLNIENTEGCTALHHALYCQIRKGPKSEITCIETAAELVKNGANLKLKDKKGKTPLHVAVQHPELLKKLLKFVIGKDHAVNAEDNEGCSVLDEALSLKDTITDIVNMLTNHGTDKSD